MAVLLEHNQIYFTAGTVTVMVLSKSAIPQRDSVVFPVYGSLNLLLLIQLLTSLILLIWQSLF